ncbi:MAG: succinylglutamate desuccinylase/aspartoacylase family protein [Chitinophagaceae bacterium]|nr:succinylglutamate desuccinylase/aspartoacylase family protein [Polaromonas sp.]
MTPLCIAALLTATKKPASQRFKPSRWLGATRWRAAVSGTAVLLAACSSVPLPLWSVAPNLPMPPATVRTNPNPNPNPNPSTVTAPVTPATPATVGSQSTPFAAPVSPTALTTLPYGAAVAARFAVPAVLYSTPGLQSGRSSYTSQSEVQSWLREQSSAAVRTPGVLAAVLPFGSSQRGQTLEALVLTRASGTDAGALLASGRPTVLLVAQKHGNEPAGSEALLVLSRELAQGLLLPLLERINVIIVPRANPDGAATDQRATANGLDMNRDHLLLKTPETQALAKLSREYQPAVVVDAHEYQVVGRYLEKFGSIQKYDALLQYATTANLPEFLTKAAEEWFRRPVVAALSAQDLTSEWYYTTSTDALDKKVAMGGTQPDTGRNVDGLKNTISLLIETRGVGIGRLHLQRRVHTHVTAMTSVLASTAQRTSELNQLLPYLAKDISAKACKDEAVVEAAATPGPYNLTMLDPLSGADKIVTVDWQSSLALRNLKARARPCGYWLSATSELAVERLRMQGVQVQRLLESGGMLGDTYIETSRTEAFRQDVRGTISDGGEVLKVEVNMQRGLVDVPRGSYYISLAQPLANLIVAALEPDTQSSYFANGLLDRLQNTVRVMTPPNTKFESLAVLQAQ